MEHDPKAHQNDDKKRTEFVQNVPWAIPASNRVESLRKKGVNR